MAETKRGHTAPGYVVLHQADDGRWGGKAKPNDAYVAVLRSEWRIASDW